MTEKRYEGRLYVAPCEAGEMVVAVSLGGLFLGATYRQNLWDEGATSKSWKLTSRFYPMSLEWVLQRVRCEGGSLSDAVCLTGSVEIMVEAQDVKPCGPPLMRWK